jgi:hypothetical protein
MPPFFLARQPKEIAGTVIPVEMGARTLAATRGLEEKMLANETPMLFHCTKCIPGTIREGARASCPGRSGAERQT